MTTRNSLATPKLFRSATTALVFIACAGAVSCTRQTEQPTTTVPDFLKTPKTVESTQRNTLCTAALYQLPKYEATPAIFGKIHEFFLKYAECMDAGIAESIEDTVTRALSENWNSIDELFKLTSKDAKFETFVVNNLNASVTGLSAEVHNVQQKATSACPPKMKSFCAKLKVSAERALKAEAEEK